MEWIMQYFSVKQIENGYELYQDNKTTFFETKEELIKKIVDIIVG